MHAQCFSCVQLCATPWTAAHQTPLSTGFSRQEHRSGLPFPSPKHIYHQGKLLQSCPTLCNPMDCSMPGSPVLHQLQNLPRFMSSESVMLSDHLIFCCPLLLPSIFPSIRVFSNELALCIKWPKYWSFSFSISPSSEYSELSLYLSIVLKIFLFLALLGLCCCTGFSLAAMLGFLIAVASFVERGLSRASGLQQFSVPGLQSTASIVVMHGLSCSIAYGIFLEQGSNLCLLHWQVDPLPLSHHFFFLISTLFGQCVQF